MKNIFRMKMLVSVLIITAAVVMGIYGWTILPDMGATPPASLSTGAPPMPKAFVIGLATALMVMFGYLGGKERKMYMGALIGVALHMLFWVTN